MFSNSVESMRNGESYMRSGRCPELQHIKKNIHSHSHKVIDGRHRPLHSRTTTYKINRRGGKTDKQFYNTKPTYGQKEQYNRPHMLSSPFLLPIFQHHTINTHKISCIPNIPPNNRYATVDQLPATVTHADRPVHNPALIAQLYITTLCMLPTLAFN